MSMQTNFSQYMPQVVELLLGKPNPHHSKPGEPRWGTNGSLKINLESGVWNSFEGEGNGGVLDLIIHQGEAGNRAEAVAWLESKGIHKKEEAPKPAAKARVVARYDYTDEHGEVLFQVERLEPKSFRQRRPAQNGKGWIYKGISEVRKVPYRLPQLLQQPDALVFIPEGEKDADNLAAAGLVATCNAGGAGKWADALTPFFTGRDVVILPDNDTAGATHRDLLIKKLVPVAKSVRVLELSGLSEKGDVSDWLAAGGTADKLVELALALESVRLEDKQHFAGDIHNMTPVDPHGWPNLSMKNSPLNTRPNVECLLQNYGIRVRYNEISKDVEVDVPGLAKTDAGDNTAISEIMSLAALNRLPVNNIESHIKTIATMNSYNPVRDFILAREWDGISRFDALLATLETEDGFDRDLMALMVRRWMISAVAAAFSDGTFSSKGVLVFQGPQSIGKTAWFTSLVPHDRINLVKKGALVDPNNKDTIANVIGHWLVELGELDATFRKSDIARLKSFIDQQRDDLRRPYDRVESRYTRRTVFFASVNPKHFLVDETGNVRFWTVPVTAVDYKHSIDMQQMWAEVYSWYSAGEQWWLDKHEEDELKTVNEDHSQIDPMEEKILARFEWGSTRSAAYVEMTCSQVLMEIGIDNPNKSQATKCADILTKLTGHKARKTYKGRFYMMPPKVKTFEYFNESLKPF